MTNNHQDLSDFQILMDECIEVPRESLPVAEINLEKMFTYMQIQKSSSNSFFIFFFRENFSEKSCLRISVSKVLPGTLWKWLEQMKYDKKREKELKDKIIEASIKEKIQFKIIISSQNDFWMILRI